MKTQTVILILLLAALGSFAEPGASYTLTGDEEGIEEIVKADMTKFPTLYEGETFDRYLLKFKSKNKIGRKKFNPGDQLQFPITMAALKIPVAVSEQDGTKTRGETSAAGEIKEGMMAGYLIVAHDDAKEKYNAGFSMYVAAWPLLDTYPGNRFQTGLFGTWMFAQNDDPKPEEKMYSDIEGGLGWWRDTRFATATPKFIMGGVALNFSAWANGPGAGKGRDWHEPTGKYGVAQLSPWILWPPDGLNLKQSTSGELFGYGYLPLPLTPLKSTTEGQAVPTGNQCWTLFLNTQNFKGPVAFFTPYFFSRETVDHPHLAGLFLDARPSRPNRSIQMETQYVPAVMSSDTDGETYARIAPTSFPQDDRGDSVLIHHAAVYSKKALWDSVQAWFDGGSPADGIIDPHAADLYTFPGHGGATWKIYAPSAPKEKQPPLDWTSFATPTALDSTTFGYRWDDDVATFTNTAKGALVTLPEYYHLEQDGKGVGTWMPIQQEETPAATGLARHRFSRPTEKPSEPYLTPEDPDSCWKNPGPVAGPFLAYPGDGSEVTYYWYRFADQPALLNADLTDEEREILQKRVETLHLNWKMDRDYLPPPTIGKLAHIDLALIVSPPTGLEVGYVPIVTRQSDTTPPLMRAVDLETLTGTYQRNPVKNDWHVGTISVEERNDQSQPTVLRWTNRAGRSWRLFPDKEAGGLRTDEENPYYAASSELSRMFLFEFESDQPAESPPRALGFRFKNQLYVKNPGAD
jgi:hypothetical protein